MISIPSHTLKSSFPDPMLARAIEDNTIYGIYSNGDSALVCVTTFCLPDGGYLSLYAMYVNTKKRLEQNLFSMRRYDYNNGASMNMVSSSLTRYKWYDTLRKYKGHALRYPHNDVWPTTFTAWQHLPLDTRERVLRGFR